MSSLGEEIAPDGYIDAVLSAYTGMPETPVKPTVGDRTTARALLERGVPLGTIHTALTLGSVRRLARPPDSPRLQPIHSLAYFLPVIDELLETPLPQGYVAYLRTKLAKLARGKLTRRQPRTGDRPENYVSS